MLTEICLFVLYKNGNNLQVVTVGIFNFIG